MVVAERINNYRYIKKNTIATMVLFFIYPIAAIPFIVQGMLNNKRWAFVLWAFFMGLLGLLYPPTGDLYRYTTDFLSVKGVSWAEFKFFLTLKQDWLLPYISYIIGKLGLNFDLSRFIYNFVSYLLLGLLYTDITDSNPHYSKKNAVLFLGTFIIFSIGAYTIRFSASTVLFAYGAYNVVYKSKKSGWIFVILAFVNHLTFIVFAIALLFHKSRSLAFSKKLVIFLIIFSFTVDSSSLIKLFSFLPLDIIDHYSIYLDGYWAKEYLNDHSFLYRLQMTITSLVSYAAAIIYILTYDKYNKGITLVNSVLLLTTLVTPFATIATRFVGVLFIFIKIHFLSIYKNTKSYKKYLMALFLLTMFSNAMGLWASRRQLAVSDIKIIAYSSVPQILTHTYSEKWINSIVYDNGDFKHD